MLQIAEGWTANLPDDVHTPIDKRTDPTWPTTWFVPRLTGKGAFSDVYSVMTNWGANHGVTVYGHVGADLITLASMLRIPVAMHNVPDEKVYRPHSWAAFGTKDTEAADYVACKQYGERCAADAKPKAQIILCVLSSILATQMPCSSRRSAA